jgi:hypothetical protein
MQQNSSVYFYASNVHISVIGESNSLLTRYENYPGMKTTLCAMLSITISPYIVPFYLFFLSWTGNNDCSQITNLSISLPVFQSLFRSHNIDSYLIVLSLFLVV